ncbi:MAG: 50S ribosomal protein L32e [Candidatus Aenigmarchaeota archaeon]|nr:50S ribosomal protein L32e [Candidatus Aenigmarchaeota archaeon]
MTRISKDFRRQEKYAEKRVKNKTWRKPRGINSKMRLREGGKSHAVRIGHGSPAKMKGFHPSGFKEILINNEKQLAMAIKMKNEKIAVRIRSTVGGKKRVAMLKVADEAKLKVLNR